ncbi:MAG TPA: DUF72 domain-containing protein [Candidatus Binatia bacterium]|nr:DUF72 domain-containing protein [Candidatus Binatia bacterium]
MARRGPPRGRGALLVGTSGWAYRHWPRFYPPELRPPRFLAHYATRFPTVEVNTSFYHLPLRTTYAKWAAETGPDFRFTLKLSRYVTHIKRLSGVKAETRLFLERAEPLGEKLGPILVQLPPQLRADPARLERFLAMFRSLEVERGERVRLAFEFRHQTWFDSEQALTSLARHGAALVFGQSGRYPYPSAEPLTADWVYLRFHGPREFCASEYGREGLAPWAGKIARWRAEGRDVYAYFNNDVHGYAVEDAALLVRMAEGSGEGLGSE